MEFASLATGRPVTPGAAVAAAQVAALDAYGLIAAAAVGANA